ncbi:MAG: hypothetical protein IJ740_01260 [Ruminococcus sp.]|nr:hypothetical protein [Ruminococcus sp.]
MYEFKIGKHKVGVSFSFLALVSLLTALDSDKKAALIICILCCIVHECGHLLAMLMLGVKPQSITFYGGGILIRRMKGIDSSNFQDIIIYLCGPAANFILSIIFFTLSRDICSYSLFCGFFNLLPFSYFDGGRALDAAFPLSKAVGAVRIVFIVLLAAFTAAVFAGHGVNLSLLVTFLYIAICELVS